MVAQMTQMFPRRVDGRIVHHTWSVDLVAARQYGALGDVNGARLQREVGEMAEHFSRWVLTVVDGSQRLPCPSCHGVLVFDRGLRCVVCGREPPARRRSSRLHLGWFGLLPPIGIDGLPRIKAALLRKPPPHHVVGEQPGVGHFVLVPLTAMYPEDFPQRQVKIAYQPDFFAIPGIPSGIRHDVHMLDQGFMCLFAGGQWQPTMTCREVLQQRAYAHVVKILNYGDGKKSAFAKVS